MSTSSGGSLDEFAALLEAELEADNVEARPEVNSDDSDEVENNTDSGVESDRIHSKVGETGEEHPDEAGKSPEDKVINGIDEHVKHEQRFAREEREPESFQETQLTQEMKIAQNKKRKFGEAHEDETLADDKRKKGEVPKRKNLSDEKDSLSMCPPHPGFMWGMCIQCGKPKSEVSDQVAMKVPEKTIALKYLHDSFELSAHEADRITKTELAQLFSNRKLQLILDLDHTLLNSVRLSDVPVDQIPYMTEAHMGESSSNTLFHLPQIGTWTKLRPGVGELLKEASKLYELTVYTNGERAYANEMAKILDPTGKLFQGRVVSYRDSTRRGVKDLDIVLGHDSAVVILDDTPQVWPKHQENVIVVDRYIYFQDSQDQYDRSKQSLMQLKLDESETEGRMVSLIPVLKQLHACFFEKWDENNRKNGSSDIREVLALMRSSILKDCSLLFSGIFPTNAEFPEMQPIWQLGLKLGAECYTLPNDNITHVVAVDPGTQKAKWAVEKGIHLVHPQWLEACLFTWTRKDEHDFLLVKKKTFV